MSEKVGNCRADKQIPSFFKFRFNSMFFRFSLLFCLICTIGMPLFAQKTRFVTKSNAPEKAQSAFNDGMNELRGGSSNIAAGFFERALKIAPNFIDAHILLGGCHYEMKDYARAEIAFENAIALDSLYEIRTPFTLAICEWQQDKFEEAAQHAAQYLRHEKTNEKLLNEARLLLQNAKFAAVAIKNPVPFNPQSLGEGVNTAAEEYLPSLTADGQTLIFTRMEFGDENFYASTLQNGKWSTAEALMAINTPQNEGAEHISADGTWLVFTACDRRGDGSLGSCDIYWSQLKNSGWTSPQPFSNAINSSSWDAQPCISADGKSLYFSSTRPGGKGGGDLYVTHRLPGGRWSKPENLGDSINTAFKEQTPFLHPDGQTLYFASEGWPGMGNSDLFYSRRKPDGTWSKPQNLGYPINTKGQEGAMFVSLDGRKGYYAAVRPEGKGRNDIYAFDLPEFARPKPVTYARIKVRDAATGNPIPAKLELSEVKTAKPYTSANTRKDGTALVCLPAGTEYALRINKDKYLLFSENFNLTENASFDKPFELEAVLQPIPDSTESKIPAAAGQPVTLNNVFFETGSAKLRPESGAELDELAALLQKNRHLRIQINGHTDDVGEAAFNQRLSEQRAQTVLEYLSSKGVAAERLRAKGFGESKPIAANSSEEGRSSNRRTEFELW
jgi:outer membrane protein OmpA-like peptidoglycan-associated protein/Tfp pilus assembly protein PilF